MYVKFGEEGASTEMVYDLWDEWGDITISFGPFVDRAVVLYWPQFSIFLFDEEEFGHVGGFGYVNGSPFEVL